MSKNKLDDKELKNILANYIALKVKDGDVLGIGTASTAEAIIKAIGERIKNEGIRVSGVSTSIASTVVAAQCGISVIPLSNVAKLNWGFDGADEVTPEKVLLKGRGGAMFREKLVAKSLPRLFIAITENKLVSKLFDNFPVPVEVYPEAQFYVKDELLKLGAISVSVRQGSNFYGPLFTENSNMILDVKFTEYNSELGNQIKGITGVIEHGIFSGFHNLEVVVIKNDGSIYNF